MESKARLFEAESASMLELLAKTIAARRLLEAQEDAPRENILAAMGKHGLASFRGNGISLRIMPAGKDHAALDTQKLRKQDAGLYGRLLERFPKLVKGRKECLWAKLENRQGRSHD